MRQNSLSPQSLSRLIGCLAVFLIVAAPLAMIAWHELSDFLNGDFAARPLLRGLAAALAFLGTAFVLGRVMKGIPQ
jgi:hypothetical protein